MRITTLSIAFAAALWQPPSSLPDMYGSVHALTWVVRDLDRTVAGWQQLGSGGRAMERARISVHPGGAWGDKGKPGWGRYAYQDTDAIAGAEVELLSNYR